MKSIYYTIKQFIKEDFNAWMYLYFALFLVTTISLNYHLDFEHTVLNSFQKTIWSFVFYTLFYAFAYYFIAIPKLFFQNKAALKSKIFWFRSLSFIAITGFAAYFYWGPEFIPQNIKSYERYYLHKIILEIQPFIHTVLTLFIFWVIVDKGKDNFYGLTLKNVHIKPYFIMLSLMIPLVFWASFQPDFQYTYPILKPWKLHNVFGWSEFKMSAFYEIFYGVSFLSVEVLFRGALIIGMAKILGKDALLPMVAMYAFLHFGKPMAETIGSIFGGYILGILALKKKNIWGGVIIHMGVAYLMEFSALWQHYFNSINPH